MTRAVQRLLDLNYFLLLFFGLSLAFSIALSQTLLTIVLVSTGVLLVLGSYRELLKLPLFYPILLFLVLRLLSIVFSENYHVSASEWQKWWLPLTYFVVGLNINRLEKAKGMVWLLVVAGGAAGAYATLKYLLLDIERASSTSGGHDTLANYLVFTGCLLFSQIAVYPKPLWRQLKAIVLFPLLSGLILTFARAAYLTCLIVVGAVGFLKRRELVTLFGGLIVVLVVLWAAGPPIIKDRLTLSNPLFSTQRDILWKAGFEVLKEAPPWGHGASSFDFTFPPEYRDQLIDKKIGNWHNLYLEMVLDSGYLALLALLWILVSSFRFDLRQYRKKRRTDESFLPGLAFGKMLTVISLLIMGMFAVVLSDPIISMFFWTILALNGSPQSGSASS
jgi:O-antigen ligase